MHGIENGKLVLAEYDPQWPQLFEREKERLQHSLQNPTLTIEHIGSTSVPGLLAKPVIDIAILFGNEQELWHIATQVIGIGYEFRGPHVHPSHWYAVYNEGLKRLYHLHIFQQDSEACRMHLRFRDRLRADPEAAAAYAAAKREWAERANWNKRLYSLSKDDFVRGILEGK